MPASQLLWIDPQALEQSGKEGRVCLAARYELAQVGLGNGVVPGQFRPCHRAERFELYCCGVELANAFGELTDPVEQRARFAADMDEKERIYGERYPIDEDFLAALAIMPDASGVAPSPSRLLAVMPPRPSAQENTSGPARRNPLVGHPGLARTVNTRRPVGNAAAGPLLPRFLLYDRATEQITAIGCSCRLAFA